MALPNNYLRGPLSEEEFTLLETMEMQEAADQGYKVTIQRLEVEAKLFARVSYAA